MFYEYRFKGLIQGYGLVARGGFEPPISALRGRCPGPLDERATHWGPKMSPQQGGSASCYQTYLGFVNRRERPLQSHLTREFLFAINPNWYHLAAIPSGYFRSSKKVFRVSTSVYLRLPVSPMVMISDMLFTT